MLHDNSVSTSEQTPLSLLGIETAGHIIDPENGKPLETKYALSIVAKTGTASDALSTTLLLVGPAKGKPIVKSIADAAAIWVSAEGETETVTTGPELRLGRRSGAKESEGKLMKMWREIAFTVLLAAAMAPTSAGKVYLRWTQSAVPPATILGVSDLVIPWGKEAQAWRTEQKSRAITCFWK